jgi:hypothetical protein
MPENRLCLVKTRVSSTRQRNSLVTSMETESSHHGRAEILPMDPRRSRAPRSCAIVCALHGRFLRRNT